MRSILIATILLIPAIGQTRLDLGNQSKGIDFSQAPLVRPFRTGTTLPVTCVTGEMFFKNQATPGSNIYGCVAANTWALEGGGATLPFQISRTDNTTLAIGSDCTTVAPCSVRVGATVYTFRFPATVTLNSGSGLTYIYVNSGGSVVAGTASSGEPSLTCSGCTVLTPVTQFPLDSIPLAIWNATAGSWDATGIDNRASLSGGRTFSAGPNIIITETGTEITISATVANPAESGGGGTTPPAGGGSGYDPVRFADFDRTHIFSELGFAGPSPWAFSSGCGGSAGTPGQKGEPGGLGWSVNNGECFLFYPGGGLPAPITDFLSGTNPVSYALGARYARSNLFATGTGDHYIGWSSSRGSLPADFVGIRYQSSASQWQCLIRAAGNDIAAEIIPLAADAVVHTFTVSSGSTANSAKCQIDTALQTVSGTIPSNSWYGILGTSVPSGGSAFTTIEVRIHISGIAR